VVGAYQYVKHNPVLRQMDVGFLGHCMGANAVIMALSKKPEMFADVKCLIIIQPIAMKLSINLYTEDIYGGFAGVIKRLYPSVEKRSILLGSPPWEAMSPLPYVSDITVPTLTSRR
jgi:hypothetical protein